MDGELVDRALRAYGEAVNLVEPLRVRFWHERGLTLVQVGMLFQLDQRDGQAIGELAAKLHVRPASVTGLADRLERGGYVRRRGDASDRRVVRVSLTPAGGRVLERIRAESRTYLGRALESMGEARVEALAELLEEFVEVAGSSTEATARAVEAVAVEEA